MMTSTPESITEAELAEELARRLRNVGGSRLILTDPAASAADIFAEAVRNREPVYEPGGMYQDANGGLWLYEPPPLCADAGSWAELPWLKPGVQGAFGYGTPERPLRRLVPEGSQEHAATLVAEWRGLGEQDDAVPAWRGGYRAALRKCADELEYALKQGDGDE